MYFLHLSSSFLSPFFFASSHFCNSKNRQYTCSNYPT
jgi:hypothetical protein